MIKPGKTDKPTSEIQGTTKTPPSLVMDLMPEVSPLKLQQTVTVD